jgi:nucleotide-binding universal stress UspA family protein
MYKRILVPLENTKTDAAVVAHVISLAKLCTASVVLIHVADGWVARNAKQLDLRESEEMKHDLAYLDRISEEMDRNGVRAEGVLAGGDPASEICAAAAREKCDLIAMSTHGHGFVQDVIRGSVANQVRHQTRVPVLMVRGDEAPK